MIHARIASTPDRINSLERTVKSLRNQVSQITVILNNYPSTPSFLNEGEYIHRQNQMADAEKFYDIENVEEFILMCDDDIQYPANYADYMISNIIKYNAVVTLHGKSYTSPVVDFRKWSELYRCLCVVSKDVRVQVPGTGVLAFKSGMLNIKYEDFKSPYMADLWFAKLCYEQNVPIYCLKHDSRYLKHTIHKETIWRKESKNGFKEQTKLLQSFIR